jgi:hypothetical protein
MVDFYSPDDSPRFTNYANVTPSDTLDLSYNARSFIIGVAGNLKVRTIYNTDVTIAVPAGVIPIIARRVFATGTTATGIVALF